MRLYFDNQYTPGFIKLIERLHSLQFNQAYEIVSGQWQNEFTPAETVVFLWETNKKGISRQIARHFEDGYKVFTFRKPYGQPFDIFKILLIMLSQWKNILEKIEKENGPFLFVISSSKKAMTRVKNSN
ncbi:MAG TPA: hypothetical protein PKN44_11660 [Bacteroidales bacterium]|mgnify:CR=1 FL=1|nr:hypothetical protein [Bacteroidales bacterium]